MDLNNSLSFRNTRPHKLPLTLWLLITLFVFVSAGAHALQPSPQQIEAFKRLPASQQSQLAAQYGIDLPQSSNAASGSSSVQPTVSVMPLTSKAAGSSSESPKADAPKIASPDDRLMPFGYDLFAGSPTTFAPVHDVPVSSDYVLGPGDSLKLNLYGKENSFHELAIDTEGKAYLADLGPMSLAGLTFAEAKQAIVQTIDQKMIGVKASVSMGALRSIRVFVLGEANLPGSYVMSSLSTMTNALVLSGGVATSGSLRDIQLKRKGKVVRSFDLYDLLLKGDTSNDAQLRSGDVVFIPPVKASVGIRGEIKRPAIYELAKSETVDQLVAIAGGYTASAFPELTKIERYGDGDELQVHELDLSKQGDKQVRLKDGDMLSIPSVLSQQSGIVKLLGHVHRSGVQSWKPGLRLSHLLPRVDLLKPNADLNFGLIKRYTKPHRRLQVVSFNLAKALNAPGSEHDLVLNELDEVHVFGLYESSRNSVASEILDELRAQASIATPSKEVAIGGNVRYPGAYPLVEGMTVEQLIHAAGGLTEKAFQLRAELSRTDFDSEQKRIQSRFDLNLTDASSLSKVLNSRDTLQIKTIPEWAESEMVTLRGEVRFPGAYPIYKDDTLADLLKRAGGLTDYAYVPGAVFTRVELKKQQAERLADMQRRLKEDIAKAELTLANQSTTGDAKQADLGEAQKLLDQLSSTSATGRLVVDLEKVIEEDSGYVIPLQDGDELYVPTKKNSVTIVGEVQLPISQIYERELDYWDYINRSGGTTDKADEERIYIVKANGAVEMPETSNWFASSSSQVSPGDTIVVPLDADKVDQVILWRDLSQIFYQIALGAAAVGSL